MTEVLRVRYWQHIVNEALKQKAFKIPIHVAIGHEAIAVAVSNMMKPSDQLVLSHHNIAYNLARAGSLKPIHDEYRLDPNGVAGGKLDSMNLNDALFRPTGSWSKGLFTRENLGCAG